MNQIYKITNKINGKSYIGLTTQGIIRRWSEHKYRFNLGERDHRLYLAMRKYGIENFEYEVLETVKDKNMLSVLEAQYIKKFDSFKNGYNMTDGGEFVSEETREKLSKMFIGREITWGKKIVATKRLLDEWPCGKPTGCHHWKAGKYIVTHPNGKKEKIHGLREFCRKNNLSHNLMLAVLNGKQTHHKRYVLSRFNDYCESKYTEAGGNGGCPVSSQDSDIV